jgi:hypothetical protein
LAHDGLEDLGIALAGSKVALEDGSELEAASGFRSGLNDDIAKFDLG